MVLCRYPQDVESNQESIGFMSGEESMNYWSNEDFAPLVNTKVILDNTGAPQENEYLFTHRRIKRAGSPGTSFKIRGPLGPLSYTHQPLVQPQAQVRIVTLQPGTGLEPLRCSMSTHNFPSGTGEYTCLSYVWGTPKGTYPMVLDCGIIGITENLLSALWHIRRKRKPIRLWIDALCINQNDDEEKAHQVKIMGEIFEKASRMISWLGSTQSDTREISRDLKRLFQASLDWDDNTDSRRRLATAFTKVNWINLRPIFDSAYWTRAWIVQEIAIREESRALFPLLWDQFNVSQYPMARRHAQWPKIRGLTADYLLYGRCSISFWCILVITEAIESRGPRLTNILRSMPDTGNFNETVFSLPKELFANVILVASGTVTDQLHSCSTEIMEFPYAYSRSCSGLRVGLDRDRLFSLAGLYKDLEIVVDYNKPETEVVLDIAERIVTSGKKKRDHFLLPWENHGLRPVPGGALLAAADTLVSWVEYGQTILFPCKPYCRYFFDLQEMSFRGKGTDTFENTTFVRGPGWGKLHSQCMYRAKVVKLFQKNDNKELRKAMSARFGGNKLHCKEIYFLLGWLKHKLPFNESSTNDLERSLEIDSSDGDESFMNDLERYLDIDGYDDEDINNGLLEVVWTMQQQGHNVGILSDGNLFVGCSYSQINDEVVLMEGFFYPFIVRNANPQGEVMFVEKAILVGLHRSKLVTRWREELIMI